MEKELHVDWNGRKLDFEIGTLALRASASALLRAGETAVLAVLVHAPKDAAESREDFLPLTVHYSERASAFGKIPPSAQRREGRANEHEILTARFIDRAIRPLFPPHCRDTLLLSLTVLSVEKHEKALTELSLLAASACLLSAKALSWRGPVVAYRALDEGMDALFAFHQDGLLALEGSYDEISKEALEKALALGEEEARPLLLGLESLRTEFLEGAQEEAKQPPFPLREGRGNDEIRPVFARVNYLPSAHGSALFQRGDTQALVTVTIGKKTESYVRQSLSGNEKEAFYLHYQFHPFAVGEGQVRFGPSRRDLGHGELASRALRPLFQGLDAYALRVSSEILTSNGSSSMASVSGASLALLDAGVRLERAVSGISVGLKPDGKTLLLDITEEEDALGRMDFKVAGSTKGLTATQLDVKRAPVSLELISQALGKAELGLKEVLAAMAKVIDSPRKNSKKPLPKVAELEIPEAQVPFLIGPGGQEIARIENRTESRIKVKNSGQVKVSAMKEAQLEAALRWIRSFAVELKKGGLYDARVKQVKSYGVFVEVGSHSGLLHESELKGLSLEALKEGDELSVRLLGADEKGRLKFSNGFDLG